MRVAPSLIQIDAKPLGLIIKFKNAGVTKEGKGGTKQTTNPKAKAILEDILKK
jgi:hypothetical protein